MTISLYLEIVQTARDDGDWLTALCHGTESHNADTSFDGKHFCSVMGATFREDTNAVASGEPVPYCRVHFILIEFRKNLARNWN